MRSRFIVPLLLLGAGNLAPIVMAQSQGVFSSTGHLTTERMFHTAALLTNGKVLVAGGSATLGGFSVWASAELYDLSTGTFSATGSMNTPRVGHTATLLPDGRVLITGGNLTFGGALGDSAQVSAELYDPLGGTSTPTGSMAAGRAGHTATLLNTGKVLITGGYSFSADGSQISLSSAELYDPLTGTFQATSNMAAGRAAHTAVLLGDGKVLIEGGGGGSCTVAPNPELYDPVTGAFNLTGSSAYPALFPVAASLLANGSVLTTLDAGCDFDNRTEVYNSSNGTFASAANMTTDRGYSTATLLPDNSVLITGRDASRVGGSAELYNPSTGAFSAANGMFPQSEEGHTATLLPNGAVLLAGGWICCGFSVANAELYNPAELTPSPVLYSLSSGGLEQGAIWHAATGQIASASSPAVAGDVLSMYTTSLIEGGVIPPQIAVGAQPAEILFFGDAPGYPGYFQVNFRVPSGVAPESAVPVRLTYLNRSSNAVTIAVQ
jgi:hypothetical protein